MANNWFIRLKQASKSDETAAQLVVAIEKAETDEEKEIAKQNAQAYIGEIQVKESEPNPQSETTTPIPEKETESVDKDKDSDPVLDNSSADSDKEKIIFDMSAPAFNPRLAKMGITREEELFTKGVCVRKLSHDDKILMRRSIYNKKQGYMSAQQAKFKKERAKARAKAANDPELIKYHNERKYVDKIVDALRSHRNFTWMFTNINGLTPDIVKELLKNPGNVNAFNAERPDFTTRFNKKYGG